MKIAILGLSITSSWGNGHAVTFRALCKALVRRGHEVLFLERETEWYRQHRDHLINGYGTIALYHSTAELQERYAEDFRKADLTVIGSYVPEGVRVIDLVAPLVGGALFFYDLDTPLTLAKIDRGDEEYLAARQVRIFDRYLSFAAGPVLDRLTEQFGAKEAVPFYCTFDPDYYRPESRIPSWDLGYLGTYSADRAEKLERLFSTPARQIPHRRFVVAGALYPEGTRWGGNVAHVPHISPENHAEFYSNQRYTLNLTREAMVKTGYAPSTRLFEAAACGTAILSDYFAGLEQILEPHREVLIVENSRQVQEILEDLPETTRDQLRDQARRKVLQFHTAEQRAITIEKLTKLNQEEVYGQN